MRVFYILGGIAVAGFLLYVGGMMLAVYMVGDTGDNGD